MKKLLELRGVRTCIPRPNLAMKLTVLLTIVCILQIQANTYAQNKKITLNLQDVTVGEVLYEIESLTEFKFLLNRRDVDLKRRVSISVEQEMIKNILAQLFADTNVIYKVVKKQIVLRQENIPQKQSTVSKVSAPIQLTVNGVITDSDGVPLSGANVLEKGTSNGVTADFDGKFSIEMEIGTLVVSYIGFATKEITISDNSDLNIVLNESTAGLDEVVVVGYGTTKKSDLTGSVATANIEAFRESPNTNILQSLSGSVPGLSVAQVTASGETPSLTIRGKNSISGSNAPLIIVDGIMYYGALSTINSADVERIDVLKDASSAAVYGAAAANGVIIVTTKQATKGHDKPVFNFSSSVAFSNPTSLPTPLNAQEYYDKAKDIMWEQGYYGPEYTEVNPEFDPTKIWIRTPVKEGWENGNNFDWLDAVTQTGIIQDNLLSMSKRDENSDYYLSMGYTEQSGYIKNDTYERWTGRINFNNQLTDWMKIGIRSFVASEDYSGAEPNIMRAVHFSPLVTPYDSNGDLVTYPDGQIYENPFYTSEVDDLDKRIELNGIGILDISLPFIKGLTYRATFNAGYNSRRRFYFNQWANAQNGAAQKYYATETNWTFDNILNYKRSLNESHDFNITLVAGQQEREFENTDSQAAYYINKALGYNSLESGSAANSSINSGAWSESSLYAMGRLNYSFKNKYLTTFTIRRDGFSGFAANKKWGTFPSAAIGWVISEEGFVENNLEVIDYLKLRASYGVNGNRTGRYASQAIVTSAYQYVFGNDSAPYTGQYISKLPNSDLGWERTVGSNIGLDFSIGRFSGAIDYYNSKTTDLFWNIQLPQITGFTNIASNIGKLNNTGLELTLTSINMQNTNFSWETTFNYTMNRNKLLNTVDIDGDGDDKDDLISQNLFIGESIDAIYDYTIDGIYQLNDEIPSGYYPGTYRLRDLNNDGTVTPLDDRSIIGYQDPAYLCSLINTFSYKDFGLMIYINSIQGGKNRYMDINDPVSYISGKENVINDNTYKEWDYWYPANPDARYARIDDVRGGISPYRRMQRSFVRIQDINFSYRFSPELIDLLGLNSAKLFLSGKNLFTFTKWPGLDPEADRESPNQVGLGLTNRGRPVMKSISLGLNISF